MATTLPLWPKIMNRVLVVPWSRAPTYLLIRCSAPVACGCLRLEPGVGCGLEQEMRGGRTRVLVTRAAFSEVARSTLAGDERDRGHHALLGCRDGCGQGFGRGDAPVDA